MKSSQSANLLATYQSIEKLNIFYKELKLFYFLKEKKKFVKKEKIATSKIS
jgi:hypothetical protein